MFTYISLFTGIGGFDLGFERAGMICTAQVEINKDANGVLAHHWPNVKRLKDVRNVTKSNVPAVDLIAGGFPCQDVSVAGRRKGLAGERSGLWFEFLRILTESQPRWVVIENVPGLLSSNKGRDFATILQGLVQCGYGVCWRVLDAQYFGLAQRRKRLFIIGHLGDGRAAEILFERESGVGYPAKGRETWQTTAGESGSSVESYRFQRSDQYTADDKALTLAARDFKFARDLVAYNLTFCDSNGLRKDRVKGGLYVNETEQANTLHAGNPSEKTLIAGTLSASGAGTARPAGQKNELDFLVTALDVRNSRSNGEISGTLQAKKSGGYSLNYQNQIALYYTNERNQDRIYSTQTISPALTSQDSNKARNIYTQSGVRRLTPTEYERLQGFPDGWTVVNNQSDSARYRQLGNAVCVNVAEWIGRRIMESELKFVDLARKVG